MSGGQGENGSPPRPIPIKDTLKPPLPKRFYRNATAEARDGAFAVLLDGRAVKTPGKQALSLPTIALAEAVAAEWNAQGTHINPASMPITRIVNSAIDGVAREMDAVVADIVQYAGSDLVCYRADAPQELVQRQADAWDGVLAWAARELGQTFNVAAGIVFVAQPPGALAAVGRVLAKYGPLELAALHVMTTLTGSALLALAHADGALSADAVWAASHVDEDWQISQWGTDEEAAARRAKRYADMLAAARVLAAAVNAR